jgi:hypothetical protein
MAVGLAGGLAFIAAAWIAASVPTPPAPTASLQAARLAVSSTEQSGASRYAGEELSEPRNRLVFAAAEADAAKNGPGNLWATP